jgi:hypothetical protein
MNVKFRPHGWTGPHCHRFVYDWMHRKWTQQGEIEKVPPL